MYKCTFSACINELCTINLDDMKHLLLILLISVFLINCSNKKNSPNSESASREKFVLDSMRKVLSYTDSAIYFTDSIRIIYGTKHYETVIFIDYNVNSKIHRYVEYEPTITLNSESSCYSKQYLEQLEKRKGNKITKFTIPELFKFVWVQVFSYEKSFYLLADYPYQDYYGINDSTIIKRGQMCAEPYIIDSISSTNNSLEMYTTEKGVISFKEIDNNKSIYLMKSGNECVYLIPLKRIHEFPIIYHLSSTDPTASVNEYIKLDSIECK